MLQLLHIYLKHFVNVLLIHHMECSRKKEIFDIATIIRHGLTSKRDDILTGNIADDNYTPGLYFPTSSKPEESSKFQ